MTMKRFLMTHTIMAVCFVAGLVLVPGLTLAETWENVSITTVDGWEYPGVTLEVDEGAANLVLINSDGARRSIARSRIRIIRDADGYDITRTVLEGGTEPAETIEPVVPRERTGPTQPLEPRGARRDREFGKPTRLNRGGASTVETTTPSEPTETRRRNQRGRTLLAGPRFRFSPTVGVGYGTPSGDWFEGFTGGMAIDGGARIAVTEEVYIAFNYRHQKLGVESSLEYMYGYAVDWDVSLTEYMFCLGVMTEPSRRTSPIGYLEFGFGGVKHDLSFTISDGYGGSASMGTDETKFGMLIAGGGIFPLGGNAGIDIGVNMRLTGSGEESGYESSNGFLIGIRAGLVLLIGS